MKMMKAFKDIDIAEPIWKTKSVGLAVDDVPHGENVKVTISYIRKKDGKPAFPGEYIVEVDKIRQYPAEKIRGGIKVHIVPIADLAKLTVFSNNSKQNNMLFNSSQLGKIIKESEEAKQGNFDNKKLIEPGKHILTMVEITLEHAKGDNNPMIVAEFQLDEEHRTIKEFMKIAGPNTDIPREKLVKLFHRGFNYEIQPCQTEADLINQLVKFKGKQLTVAVKGVKKAYSFQDKEKNDVVMEQTYPEFWYCGTAAEFDDFYIDTNKMIKPLSDEDKQKLVAFAELNGGPYIPKSKQDNAEDGKAVQESAPQPEKETPQAPQQQAEAPAKEAKPIEEVPAKEEPVKKEAPTTNAEQAAPAEPTAEQPASEEKKEEGDDDFPF